MLTITGEDIVADLIRPAKRKRSVDPVLGVPPSVAEIRTAELLENVALIYSQGCLMTEVEDAPAEV